MDTSGGPLYSDDAEGRDTGGPTGRWVWPEPAPVSHPGPEFARPEAQASPEDAPPPPARGWWAMPLHADHARRALAVVLAVLAVVQISALSWMLSERASAGEAERRPVRPLVAQAGPAGESIAQRVARVAGPSVVDLVSVGGGEGSGFFVRPGRILTSLHVVAPPGSAVFALLESKAEVGVQVRLADGRVRPGTVAAWDARSDLALVAVEPVDGIGPLAFATSAEVEPGQPVVAIGSPFGLHFSVSEGVVSSARRNTRFRSDPLQSNLIQTDAAVNPGNSGGPLLDARARVVGVITLRPDTDGGRAVEGVSFAVPADLALATLSQLEIHGRARWARLGITGRSSSPDDAVDGMVIEEVAKGTGAAASGLRPGDIITNLAGRPVGGLEELVAELLSHRPGERIAVSVRRGAKTVAVRVLLDERPPGA